MLSRSIGYRITTNNMLNFIKCPYSVLLSSNVSEYENNAFKKTIRNTFNYFMLQRKDNLIVSERELKRHFCSSYNATVTDVYNDKKVKLDNKMIYDVAKLINNFTKRYSNYEDSVLGKPAIVGSEYNVSCSCGSHHMVGEFDFIWRYMLNDYITVYQINNDMQPIKVIEDSMFPAIMLYVYYNVFQNTRNGVIQYYYPHLDKIRTINVDMNVVNMVGELICIASESISKNTLWKIDDHRMCIACKYYNKCRRNI